MTKEKIFEVASTMAEQGGQIRSDLLNQVNDYYEIEKTAFISDIRRIYPWCLRIVSSFTPVDIPDKDRRNYLYANTINQSRVVSVLDVNPSSAGNPQLDFLSQDQLLREGYSRNPYKRAASGQHTPFWYSQSGYLFTNTPPELVLARISPSEKEFPPKFVQWLTRHMAAFLANSYGQPRPDLVAQNKSEAKQIKAQLDYEADNLRNPLDPETQQVYDWLRYLRRNLAAT